MLLGRPSAVELACAEAKQEAETAFDSEHAVLCGVPQRRLELTESANVRLRQLGRRLAYQAMVEIRSQSRADAARRGQAFFFPVQCGQLA